MNQIITENINIEDIIYEVRGKYVILDEDAAFLFNYETKNLNKQVQRNIERFPEEYCFKLTREEYLNLRFQNVTSSLKFEHGGRRYMPYAFTEHGITMLAGILKSKTAVKMSIKIVNTFITMRRYISNNLISQKNINNMVLEHEENFKIVYEDIKLLQETFNKLGEKRNTNEIFFNGQIYDAYSKILDIFTSVQKELVIVDNYADKITLDIIRNLKCKITLITKRNSNLSKLDIEKYIKQYHNLKIIYNNTFHDRYFILDNNTIYHCGTSINHAGSSTFSINIMEDKIVKENLIKYIEKIKCKL